MNKLGLLFVVAIAMLMQSTLVHADQHGDKHWLTYEGGEGAGKGKHVVLISGDEEYRSEEVVVQLGKILSSRHGFKCTMLFAIDPKTGKIDPNNGRNIPGLQALASADLMVIATRFRDLPDEQMKHIDDYLKRGGAVIGLRTATHAFNIRGNKTYAHYGNGYGGPKKEWKGGFGRLVLGEKWISHHGGHKRESTRGILTEAGKNHPITRGIPNGSKTEGIWGDTDVYGVRLPLPGDSKPLVLGQVLKTMKPDSDPVEDKKNNPMMPVAWTKSYQIPDGNKGQVFTTTMGSSSDLVSQGTRRLIVNAVFHLCGVEVPKDGTNVDIVGEFKPTMYGFKRSGKGKPNYWVDTVGKKPSDFKMKK